MPDETIHPASVELETQLRRLEAIADPATRSVVTDVLASVLQFHTAALERMLELIAENERSGSTLASFDRDPLIRSVLLVHDLHPDTLKTRVLRAISDLEPVLNKRGASLNLIAAEGGLVRLQIKGGSPGHPLAPAVEAAVRSAAPDAVQVIIEEPSAMSGFVSLDSLREPSTEHATCNGAS